MLRPAIAMFGAVGNAVCLAMAGPPSLQSRVLAVLLSTTIGAFFLEARWLRCHALSERWLLRSLLLTWLALSVGSALSGGLASPMLPLMFAPVVVGFAAFGRTRQSASLLGLALASLTLIALVCPLLWFPPPPEPWSHAMRWFSAVSALALLAIGVVGLVDAHAESAAELERARADMLDAAERRAQNLEQLGASVAHEVKNPLAAARGLAQLVQRRLFDTRDLRRLDVVVREIDHAIEVLREYLELSRPLGELAYADLDARGLLEEVAFVLEARARDNAVHVMVAAESVSLRVDRQRVRDAVLNLALNGITAMPRGGTLTLDARRGNRADKVEVIEITVRDEGIGMRPELLARVGQPFTTESKGGTGLGVLIARGVATQHGGELLLRSTQGRGTCATLRLPRRPRKPNSGRNDGELNDRR